MSLLMGCFVFLPRQPRGSGCGTPIFGLPGDLICPLALLATILRLKTVLRWHRQGSRLF
jgi:hypothetical protein